MKANAYFRSKLDQQTKDILKIKNDVKTFTAL